LDVLNPCILSRKYSKSLCIPKTVRVYVFLKLEGVSRIRTVDFP